MNVFTQAPYCGSAHAGATPVREHAIPAVRNVYVAELSQEGTLGAALR
jgi:hypothetical protein